MLDIRHMKIVVISHMKRTALNRTMCVGMYHVIYKRDQLSSNSTPIAHPLSRYNRAFTLHRVGYPDRGKGHFSRLLVNYPVRNGEFVSVVSALSQTRVRPMNAYLIQLEMICEQNQQEKLGSFFGAAPPLPS